MLKKRLNLYPGNWILAANGNKKTNSKGKIQDLKIIKSMSTVWLGYCCDRNVVKSCSRLICPQKEYPTFKLL